jgi:hypothetical protein
MLHAMNFGRFSFMRAGALVLALASSFAVTGCSKDTKDGVDAAAEAAAAVIEAAPAAAADAAVTDAAVAVTDASVADASAVPAPVATVQQTGKPKIVDPPICASARSAKARKSPAAPNLEKQCLAAGGTM